MIMEQVPPVQVLAVVVLALIHVNTHMMAYVMNGLVFVQRVLIPTIAGDL